MRFYYKLLFALLLTVAIHSTANADTLTIRQTFNLHVGDSLRYRNYEHYILCYDMRDVYRFTGFQSFKIVSKQYSGDTLQYIMNTTINDSYNLIDTVVINNLNSPITSYTGILNPHYSQRMFFDAHVIDSNAYHYSMYEGLAADSLISNRCEAGFFESSHYVNYIEGIGIFNNEHFGWGSGPGFNPDFCAGGIGTQLIYYQSDSTTWIDTSSIYYLNLSDVQTNPLLRVFPNPANAEITISGTKDKSIIKTIAIYNVTGQCLKVIKTDLSTSDITINTTDLSTGFYFLQLSDGERTTTKSFIISR